MTSSPRSDTWRTDLAAALEHADHCPGGEVDIYANAGPDGTTLCAVCRTCRAEASR